MKTAIIISVIILTSAIAAYLPWGIDMDEGGSVVLNKLSGNAAPYKGEACDLFTYANAEKVLGGKVTVTDNRMNENHQGRLWTCTFEVLREDGKEPKLHFMLVQNISEESARQALEEIRAANRGRADLRDWPGIADEAMVRADGDNFQLVIMRKGKTSIRAKVNPAQGVSIDDLKKAMASLVPKIDEPKYAGNE